MALLVRGNGALPRMQVNGRQIRAILKRDSKTSQH